eukprot:g76019.t1
MLPDFDDLVSSDKDDDDETTPLGYFRLRQRGMMAGGAPKVRRSGPETGEPRRTPPPALTREKAKHPLLVVTPNQEVNPGEEGGGGGSCAKEWGTRCAP